MRTTVNGLEMPADFATAAFEHAYARVTPRARSHPNEAQHFSAAWNAIAFRYLGLVEYGDRFTASIASAASGTELVERYRQEQSLFGFFSNAFSAFEAFFYGLYAAAAILQPTIFPFSSPKDQQRVNPSRTESAFNQAFSGDAILPALHALLADPSYIELKEVRNILTHRTAPGRTIYVGIGSSKPLPATWKLNEIVLDGSTASHRRTRYSRMLGTALQAAADFSDKHFP